MTAAVLLPPAAFLLLFVSCLSLQLIVRSRDVAKRRRERFRSAFDRHERFSFVDLLDPGDFTAKPQLDLRGPLGSRIFGYNPHRLDLYPWRPPGVAGVALVLAAAVACLMSMVVGRVALLSAVPLWPVVTRLLFRRWERKHATVLFEQFPDALAMVVRGVRVGIPVGEAIGIVARDGAVPTATEFGHVVAQTIIGTPLPEALTSMAERNGLPEYRFFATALSLQSQTGGNLSETLEGLADTIRKRVAARARGYALAAEARTSANVLTALPVVLLGALWFMNPGYIGQLVFDSTGHMILGTTSVLLGLGTLSMRMLIRRSLS